MTSNFYLPDRVDVEGGIMLDRGPNGGVIYLGNNDKRSEAGDGSLEPGDLIFTILEPLICVVSIPLIFCIASVSLLGGPF